MSLVAAGSERGLQPGAWGPGPHSRLPAFSPFLSRGDPLREAFDGKDVPAKKKEVERNDGVADLPCYGIVRGKDELSWYEKRQSKCASQFHLIRMPEPSLGQLFDWFEYSVFGITLAISVLVGVYYGFFKTRGQNTVEGYILGEKQISLIPMGTSLVASFISGIALLALGSEVYTYGTQYFISNITYIPIVIYAPALALNQVGKVNIHLITPIVCAVCIFYSSVGGLKAVVWTDLFQTTIMVGSMSAVLYFGLNATGGWTNAYNDAVEGGRWEWFNMDLSPTSRMTFWTASCGMLVHWLGESAVNPSFVQRLVALPTENQAKWAIVILTFGSIFFRLTSGTIGLLAYAKYRGCDPLSTKAVGKQDQIAPYFVLDVVGHIKGLPGLYMSGIFAAALSTMSGGLNTISATIYKDLMLPMYKVPPSDEKASSIMKRLSLSFGILSVILIFLVEKLGNILEVTNSLGGSSCGILMSIFVLGIFIPFANTKGAAWGGATGTVIGIIVIAGNRYAQMTGHIVNPVKPMSVEDCPMNVTTIYGSDGYDVSEDYIFPLFKVTFQYHSMICFLSTLLVGMCVSSFTGGNKGKVLDPKLFSPYVHRFLDIKTEQGIHNTKEVKNGGSYVSVPLQEINKTS
ncbi:hypothetical protein GE061_009987 [Apolygus lucorum]|uniref:Sodium/solute symporter n=1 Tax=Apolygus lucorum TaxID=248454 RepID=A0A8S9Y5X5_APOLU|nr:hypothetical protein GE061_009987 [Apolygus lucorum]